jgi:phage gp29-like protein
MTKRAKSPSKGKAKTSRTKSVRGKASRKIPQRDALDDLVDAAARALHLQLEPAWQGAVKANLKVTLAFADLFADFPLPDDAEPAPVFTA